MSALGQALTLQGWSRHVRFTLENGHGLRAYRSEFELMMVIRPVGNRTRSGFRISTEGSPATASSVSAHLASQTTTRHGVQVQRRSADRIARAGIGFVPEDRQIFPEHSVEDNLLIGAKPGLAGRSDWTLKTIYDVFPMLAAMRSRMGGRLSGGEQQMLTIARTLMGNPDLLLLDEPSEGLAPIIVEKNGELIQRLRGMGITLVVAEQNMHFCLDIASHVAVIDKGHIVYRDTIGGLKANADVKSRYLAV
jgi:branched-chain amino acid transport system ATP-binding protein